MNSRPFTETLGGSGEYISAPVQGKLRQTDDIVTRLYDWGGVVDPTLWDMVVEAVDEIERLRRMAQTMAGFISTTTEWLNSQPEDVYHAFYDKAVLDAPNS